MARASSTILVPIAITLMACSAPDTTAPNNGAPKEKDASTFTDAGTDAGGSDGSIDRIGDSSSEGGSRPTCDGKTPTFASTRAYVGSLPHPMDYVPLDDGQLDAVRAAAAALVAGDVADASAHASAAGYRVLPVRAGSECLLTLAPGGATPAGQGTLIVRTSEWARDLMIEAPHVPTDHNTDLEGALVFDAVRARALSIAGAARCAVTLHSNCHPSPECDPTGKNAVQSDPAHSVESAMHAMHLGVVAPNATRALQLHTNLEQTVNGDALTSDGTREPGSAIAQALATKLGALGVAAKTCNDPAAPPADTMFCGEINAQGLATNGAADACSGALASSGRETFFHLEQYSRNLDDVDAWSAKVAQAVEAVFTR